MHSLLELCTLPNEPLVDPIYYSACALSYIGAQWVCLRVTVHRFAFLLRLPCL